MMMKFASETTKPFVDDYLLDEDVRAAAKNGYIHIHDKDYYLKPFSSLGLAGSVMLFSALRIMSMRSIEARPCGTL